MKYYLEIAEGIIISTHSASEIPLGVKEISKEKYDTLNELIENAPLNTFEYIYKLSEKSEQYEPFERTHGETVEWYVEQVQNREMTLEEMPAEYYDEVYAIVSVVPIDPDQEFIDRLISEVNA